MPARAVHFALALKISEAVPVSKPAQLFRGNVSPDAIHMRSGMVRRDKRVTHLHLYDGALKLPDLPEAEAGEVWARALAYARRGCASGDWFALGYGTHVLANIIWSRNY